MKVDTKQLEIKRQYAEGAIKLTETELRNNLLTADYMGKDFKEACLDELIKRKLKDAGVLTNV